ncbi:MAG: molybdopterin-dependent oxidoreductase [Chloroflexota bacterium]|nr:molybdopterin-dependent oxidoreductase [Chloroflexota bacterium]
MNKRIIAVMLVLMLALSAVLMPATILADTTSVTITKYAADGTTVLNTTTIDIPTMESTLPVQGNGTTEYYSQGPTFDPSNLWDPDETLNLKNKGAVQGTDIKDLCDLVGGAVSGDSIKIQADDGYNETFAYENVYSPVPAQGPMVLCWKKDSAYSGNGYSDGMQLVFLAQTTNAAGQYVFGNQDMHDCLPEANWHYYWQGSTQYPSCNGTSIKYIDTIEIYTSGVAEWELELDGASNYIMSQTEFENGVACHSAVTWVDGTDTWSGMPLWLLCGWVDDGETHGPGAFNDDLAAAGYDITVIAADGYSKTFTSADVARNNDMIVANELNGAPLPADKYPLKLVGPDLTGGQKVGQITKIELTGLPEPPGNSLTVTTNVVLASVGISLDRSTIDYGNVFPGESSAVETVGIENTGNVPIDVTLEVIGADTTAQSFYDLSLHVDTVLYDINAVIASILVAQTDSVDTQLQVPLTWSAEGSQDANFIFWAEAQ